MTEIVRPLSPIEWGLWFLDQAVPLNFVTIARVHGPHDEARLRAALLALQGRHPHLRSRIVHGNFVRASDPLPLRLVEGGADAVTVEVERELAQPFRACAEPLARAAVVRHGERSFTVLIALHHAIGDGMSGVYALRDFVSALAEPSTLEPLAVDTPVDLRLPAAPHKGLRATAAFVCRAVWSAVRHGVTPLTLRRDARVSVLQRRPRLIHVELEERRATALADRARAEQTTVHGALSAAMILELLSDARATVRKRVLFGTPVNLRRELSPPVADSVGFFVSMLGFDAPVDPREGLWDVARALRADLTRRIERGEAHTVVRTLPKLFSLIRGARQPREFALEWARRVATTSGLTNLGRLDIETRHGEFEIESCHFAANPSALGEFLGTATSLHGRIHWNFIWPDPLITEPHARALVDGIVGRLTAAITSARGGAASAPAA